MRAGVGKFLKQQGRDQESRNDEEDLDPGRGQQMNPLRDMWETVRAGEVTGDDKQDGYGAQAIKRRYPISRALRSHSLHWRDTAQLERKQHSIVGRIWHRASAVFFSHPARPNNQTHRRSLQLGS